MIALLFASGVLSTPARAAPPAPAASDAGKVESHEPELPDAPAGFSWVKVPQARASFIRPDGWFVKGEAGNGTTALFITKEEIGDEGKRFSTGLTVNVIQDVPAKTKTSPSAFAAQAREKARQKSALADENEATHGKFSFVAYTSVDKAPPPVTIRTVFIANDTTGTLYWLILEAPEADWPGVVERYGGMLQMMLLDDEM